MSHVGANARAKRPVYTRDRSSAVRLSELLGRLLGAARVVDYLCPTDNTKAPRPKIEPRRHKSMVEAPPTAGETRKHSMDSAKSMFAVVNRRFTKRYRLFVDLGRWRNQLAAREQARG